MSSQGQENTLLEELDKANATAGKILVPEYSFNGRQSSDIPSMPSIPTSLMIPPSSFVTTNTTSTVTNNEDGHHIKRKSPGKQEASRKSKETMQDVCEIHQNLESIQSHVIRETDVLQNLHSQLSIKAHEMDRLRTEINQHERAEREALQRDQLSGYKPTVTQLGNLRGGFSRTVAMPTIGSVTSDTDSIIREYESKIEDLNTRLRMTIDLCAKQDSYYRDIIKELEDRLTETIKGRDHILTLRDKEAANQMTLMRQLEAALNKQQQHNSEKDEAITSLEEKITYFEGCYSQSLSIIDKLRTIANEEEIKRGRPGIIHSQDARNKEMTFFAVDVVIQTLQKCLYEDRNEKQLLNTKLEKVMREQEEVEKELKAKNEQLKQEYKSELDTLKKDHCQALDAATSQTDKMRENIKNLQQKMDSIKKQHEIEVSSFIDQTNVLRDSLAKIEKEKKEAASVFEKKCIDFQNANNDAKVELKLLREEKEKLFLSLSQEQASNISLKEKLAITDEERRANRERVAQISEENNVRETNLKEEIEKLKTELEEYKTMLIHREKEYCEQAEKKIENATKEEQGKANDRLNIILFELNKVNNEAEQRKNELENRNTELTKAVEENNKMRDDLEKREQEMVLIRGEKLELSARHQQLVKESEQLQTDLDAKVQYSDKVKRDFDNAQILIGKLKTQLDEREKTIASFREQGTNLAEIIERNNMTSDSLLREREELIKKVEEQVVDIQEMKKHREILAKKLKAKDKRVKEIEEEKDNLQKTVNLRNEELAAWTDERDNVLSELKARQLEVVQLREERDSLSNLLEGKDGEREKEIGKLISRLKGSEQDLTLTKKLLKSKGEMSGKAVRVAETMQREVTEKRGEMDALLNKIHWLQENFNAAVKDKMYYESKSSRLSDELQEVSLARDQLRFDVQQTSEKCDNYQKQVNHLEQALEKAAIKYADSQSIIEKLEQELARLKLKHSLELKEQERNLKTKSTSLLKVDAATIAEILARVNAGLRLPIVSSQVGLVNTTVPQKTPIMAQPITLQNLTTKTPQSQAHETPQRDNEVQQDLKCLLQDVRSVISSFHAHLTQSSINPTPVKQNGLPNTGHDISSKKQAPKDDKRLRTSERRMLKEPHPLEEEENPVNDIGYRYTDHEMNRMIDHDSASEFDGSFDVERDYFENMRPPLRSSSPKPERLSSLVADIDSYKSEAPIRDQDNDCDVTSLLSFATTVFEDTIEHQDSIENHSVKSTFMPSGRSGQPYSSKNSNKENLGTRKIGASRLSDKKTSTRKDASPPSYERAEMMLRSLAQTGNHLSKKNKEIARLLNEQDRRIKKCRDNEQGIQMLLT